MCEPLRREGLSLCVDLCGGGFLVDGFLPQVVAALVLLLHAVDEEEDEEDGEHQSHGAACDQSWKRRRRKTGQNLEFEEKKETKFDAKGEINMRPKCPKVPIYNGAGV